MAADFTNRSFTDASSSFAQSFTSGQETFAPVTAGCQPQTMAPPGLVGRSSNLPPSQAAATQPLRSPESNVSTQGDAVERSSNSWVALDRLSPDFNRDGQTDILWDDLAGSRVKVWLMNRTALSSTTFLPNLPNSNWRIQGAADFNGDDRSDILWRNYATGDYGVWLMNGTRSLGTPITIGNTPDLNWQIQATGDFNGDGETDIVWHHATQGLNTLGLMQGTAVSSWAWLPNTAGINLKLQAAGDLNQDGRLDLVWRNYLSGENLVWLMNGTSVTEISRLPSFADLNWKIQAVGNFNGDRQADLFWRNTANGKTRFWLMNGLTRFTTVVAPVEANQAWQVAPWNPTPPSDPVSLTNFSFGGVEGKRGTVKIQLTQAPRSNVTLTLNPSELISVDVDSSRPGLQTQITFTPNDWNRARTVTFTAEWDNTIADRMIGNTLSYSLSGGGWKPSTTTYELGSVVHSYLPASDLVEITDLAFSGDEGDRGTFKLRLTEAPTAPVVLSLSAGNFLVVDADGDSRNGTQSQITFTPEDWQTVRTIAFIAEVDDSSADRLTGNSISYTLSGGVKPSAGVYDLGDINDTYTPDRSRFNLDLDFRNDYEGFWTTARRAIAQKAADAWATRIANEWATLPLNYQLGRLDSGSSDRPVSFTSRRVVDDVVVFVNNFRGTSEVEGGYGSADYGLGGFSAEAPMPRVGQITINSAVYNSPEMDDALYQTMLHELGHVLGLVGLNWIGASRLNWTADSAGNLIPATLFQGQYSRLANKGDAIPLESQDGLNPVTQRPYDRQNPPSHPAVRVESIMSYGYLYKLKAPDTNTMTNPSESPYALTTPSALDFAMLADSGYAIKGINAPIST